MERNFWTSILIFIAFLVGLLFAPLLHAQSPTYGKYGYGQRDWISIGDLNPASASAAIDIKSTTKGALLPRMSTAQRNAILAPPEGLTLYNTSTNKFNYYNSASWLEFGQAINVSTPDLSAIFEASSTAKGFLIPRMSTSERDAITSPATGLMLFNTTTAHFNYYALGNWSEIGSALGTTTVAASSAVFDANSTTKGVLLPRVTTAQRDAIPSPATGLVLYNSDTNKFQFYNSVSWKDLGSGSGSGGGKNYVLNPDFEDNTAGWNTYQDAANPYPIDASGGSPTLVLTRHSSTSLAGSYVARLEKPASNLQGEGFSYDLTVDAEEQTRMMTYSFSYRIASGSYYSGTDTQPSDLVAYVYDKTNGVMAQPVPYKLECQSSISCQFKGQFQAASNSVDYRLVVHQASDAATAYTANFDSFSFGPQASARGPPITDWQAYTPTGNWSGNTIYSGQWRRVGDSVELDINVALTGAPGGTSQFEVTLPNDLSIDTTKLNDAVGSGNDTFGHAWLLDQGTSANRTSGYVYPIQTNRIGVIADESSVVNHTTPFTWAISDGIHLFAKVPILGWSSNTQMSSDADNAVVAASYTEGALAIPNAADTTTILTTKVFDTHSGYNTSTGLYTAPVAGYYKATGMLGNGGTMTANTGQIEAYLKVNGVLQSFVANSIGASTAEGILITGLFKLNVGDTVQFNIYQANGASRTFFANFTIEKQSGNQALALVDSVSAAYELGAQTIEGPEETVILTTKVRDSHGSCDTGTGVCTMIVPGTYRSKISTRFNSVAWTATQSVILRFYKNGVEQRRRVCQVEASATLTKECTLDAEIKYSAGDTMYSTIEQGSGSTQGFNGNGADNFFDLTRVAN